MSMSEAFSVPCDSNKTFATQSSEWLKPPLWSQSKILSLRDHESNTVYCKLSQLLFLNSTSLVVPQTTCSRLNPVTATFTTSAHCTCPLLKAPQGTISVNSRTYHIQCLAQCQDLRTFHSLLSEWMSERVDVWMMSVLSGHVDLLMVSSGGGQCYHLCVPISQHRSWHMETCLIHTFIFKQNLKEISPGCSLEGLMLKLKLQYFGHLMRRADSFE